MSVGVANLTKSSLNYVSFKGLSYKVTEDPDARGCIASAQTDRVQCTF